MRRFRLFGIDPESLGAALQERLEAHRAALDPLRARLAAHEGALPDLRARKATLAAELAALEDETGQLLAELDRLGDEADRPRRTMLERQGRIRRELEEGLAALRAERDRWIDLEQQIASGVMAALDPYLALTALLPRGGDADG